MNLPDKLITKWKVLRSPGDAQRMANESGIGVKETYNRAFREKKCRDEIFKVMSDFYKMKAEQLKEYV